MRKLVRVARTPDQEAYFHELRHGGRGINPPHVDNMELFRNMGGEFFLIEEKDLRAAIQLLAEENPGKEIQVYDLVSISICPAAEMITKQVTKEGILPA
jgi:hypothetical protein